MYGFVTVLLYYQYYIYFKVIGDSNELKGVLEGKENDFWTGSERKL